MQNKVRFPFLIEARLPPPATLFSPMVTPGHITGQIPGPLIFPVVAVNGGQLYKFIQVEQKVYRQHRQFQHKCCYDACRNNDYPHRYQIAQQAKFCIPSCAENSCYYSGVDGFSYHIIGTHNKHSLKISSRLPAQVSGDCQNERTA